MLKFFGKKAPPKSEVLAAPAPAPPPPAWEAEVLSLLSDLPGLGDVQNDVLGELRGAHSELMSVFRFYAQERTPERPPSPPPQPLLEAEQLRSLADVLRNESHVLADGTVSHKDVVEAAISLMLNVIRVKSVLDEAGDGFIVMDELEKRLSTPVEHRTLAALAEREAVSTTRSSLGDGGGGDVYGNREAAEAQKWFRAAGPARYESPPPARPRV